MNPNFAEPEITVDGGEGEQVPAPDIQALTQLNAAEINQQIMTARAYPRSVTNFRRGMREMVTYDEPTALSCLYALKRSGKVIEGPSIRFAEAAVQAWGNARVGARIVDIGDTFITAQGFFYDLEKNMAVAFEVMRRITNKDGERFNDDMIGVTGNAACSIALRNAILKGIPRTAWDEPYQAARRLSIGQGESISVKRDQMLKAFAPMGVTKEQIFGLLGVKGIDDVSIEQMILMNGILNAIKEGDQKVDEVFALENMVNPDVVAPNRPKRSDFNRDSVGSGGDGVTDKGAAPASGADKVVPAEEKKAPETQAAQPSAKDSQEEERLAFVKEAYDDLEALTKIMPINDHLSAVEDAGFMTDAEFATFTEACNKKKEAIQEAFKAAKKGKGK